MTQPEGMEYIANQHIIDSDGVKNILWLYIDSNYSVLTGCDPLKAKKIHSISVRDLRKELTTTTEKDSSSVQTPGNSRRQT